MKLRVYTIVYCIGFLPLVGLAAEQAASDAKVELLWPAGAPEAMGDKVTDQPSLTLYPAKGASRTTTAVIVCPGGGYGHLAVDHEGTAVAEWFNSLGINAFILRYRIAPYRHPIPLGDAQRAVRLVRSRASEWQIDPKRIGMIGFSAGGHLVSSAATHFDGGVADAKDAVDRVSCRPDFVILGYPVITFTQSFMHAGSMKNLLGPEPDPKLCELLSNEKQVTPQTPPAFLFHTSDDKGVPVQNSIEFYLALKKAGVPAEMHIYQHGPHGFGLGTKYPELSTWPKLCETWLRVNGLLPAAK